MRDHTTQTREIPATVLAIAIVIPLSLGGCGGSDRKGLLPQSTTGSLRATLDEIERSVNDGDCGAANVRAATLNDQLRSLPSSTDPQLRRALRASAERLQSLVSINCQPAQSTTPQPTPAPQSQTFPPGKQKKKKPKKPKQPPKQPQPENEDNGNEEGINPGQGNDMGENAPETGGTAPPSP